MSYLPYIYAASVVGPVCFLLAGYFFGSSRGLRAGKKEREQLEARLETSRQSNSRLRDEENRLRSELAKHLPQRQQLADAKQALAEAEEKVGANEALAAKAEREHQQVASQLDATRRKLTALQDSRQQQEQKSMLLQRQLKEALQKVEQHKKLLAQRDKQVEAANHQKSAAEAALEAVRSRQADLAATLAVEERKRAALETKRKALERVLGKAASDRDSLARQSQDLEAKLADLAVARESVLARCSELEARVETSEKERATLLARQRQLESELAKGASGTEAHQERARQLEDQLASMRDALGESGDQQLARLLQIEQELVKRVIEPDQHTVEIARLTKELAEARWHLREHKELREKLEQSQRISAMECRTAPDPSGLLADLGEAPGLRAAVIADQDGLLIAGGGVASDDEGLAAVALPVLDFAEQVRSLAPLGQVNRIILADESDHALCAVVGKKPRGRSLVLTSVYANALEQTHLLEQTERQLQLLCSSRPDGASQSPGAKEAKEERR